MAVDEYGREPGVDYSGQVWLIGGDTIEDDGSTYGDDSSQHMKIFRYAGFNAGAKNQPPHELDFITGINTRLHPKTTMVFGEIRRVEYYAEATANNFDIAVNDLIVAEDFSYARDSNGFAVSRVHTITWYREDGTPHPDTKVRPKLYNADESYREGTRRRANIFDALTMEVVGMVIATEQTGTQLEKIALGRQLVRDHKEAIELFISVSDSQILAAIAADQRSWLNNLVAPNVTIRDVILSRVDIWA